jgi:hypothetical protein
MNPMRSESPVPRDFRWLKTLLGVAIGFAIACFIATIVFGSNGILYTIVGTIAYCSGQIFLKIFRT